MSCLKIFLDNTIVTGQLLIVNTPYFVLSILSVLRGLLLFKVSMSNNYVLNTMKINYYELAQTFPQVYYF